MPKFSIYLCAGEWARPSIAFSHGIYRVCFGFCAVAFVRYDIENVFSFSIKMMDKLTELNEGP